MLQPQPTQLTLIYPEMQLMIYLCAIPLTQRLCRILMLSRVSQCVCASRPMLSSCAIACFDCSRSWFTNERLAILGALLLALLSAPQRAERRRQQLRRSGRSRGAAARTPTSERLRGKGSDALTG